MNLQLVIDARERDLISLFGADEISVKLLELGDVIIQTNEGVVLSIFERKTLDDLYASIKDGRYHNQKKRLMETFDVKKIGYIIEGPGGFQEGGDTQKKILMSCVYNMSFRDHIKVFRSMDIHDTVNFIKGLWSRYKTDPEKYMGSGSSGGGDEQIVKLGVVNTAEDYFIRALCQLPGVSLKTARAIGQKYKTFMGLMEGLKGLSGDEKLKELKSIKVGEKRISISNKVAQNIIEYVVF